MLRAMAKRITWFQAAEDPRYQLPADVALEDTVTHVTEHPRSVPRNQLEGLQAFSWHTGSIATDPADQEVFMIYSRESGSKISVSMICVTRLHRGT